MLQHPLTDVQVTFLGAEIIGAMARTRLPIITGRFLKVCMATLLGHHATYMMFLLPTSPCMHVCMLLF